MNPHENIIMRGTWLYAASVPIEIRITRSEMFYGTGDYEDPAEIRDDQAAETFSIWFESPAQPGTFNAGGGQCSSLADAVAATEKLLGTEVRWRR